MTSNKIKGTYFAKTYNLYLKNIKDLLIVFIFDVLFLLALSLFTKLTEDFALSMQYSLQISPTKAALFLFLYVLIIIFLYSFFKYIVLHRIKGIFKKEKFGFERLRQFFILNLIIIFSLVIIYFLLNWIFLVNAKPQSRSFVFIAIHLPYIFFSYAFLNIAHYMFLDTKSIKAILRKSFQITFTKIKSYTGIYLSDIVIFTIYIVLFYIVGSIVKKSPSNLLYFPLYQKIFIILTGLVLYKIIFFNRLYFYLIIREKFLKKH